MKTGYFRSLFARFVVLLLASVVSISSGFAQNKDVERLDREFIYMHFDIGEITRSQSGSRVINSISRIPMVKEQLEAIPDNLQFLLDADLDSLSVEVAATQDSEMCLIQVTGQFDSEKLCELLSQGNQYTQVKFADIVIHHWVTDFDVLFKSISGQAVSETSAESDTSPLYMAIPKPGRLLVSTSLSQLTEVLDTPARRLPIPEQYFSRFGEGLNLVLMHQQVRDSGIPGDLSAVVREQENGMLHVQATIVGRTEQDRQMATSIASILSNPKSATQMFGMSLAEEVGPDNEQSPERPLPPQQETSPHENQFSIGFQLNPGSLPVNDWQGMLTSFLTKCIKCRHVEDELQIEVKLFLGPCDFSYYPKDEFRMRNLSQLTFNAYTSEAEKEAAVRVAESQKRDSESKKR